MIKKKLKAKILTVTAKRFQIQIRNRISKKKHNNTFNVNSKKKTLHNYAIILFQKKIITNNKYLRHTHCVTLGSRNYCHTFEVSELRDAYYWSGARLTQPFPSAA